LITPEADLEWFESRRRVLRRAFGLLAVIFAVIGVLIFASLGRLPHIWPSATPTARIPDNTLLFNFGLSRKTLTRTIVVTSTGSTSAAPSSVSGATADVLTARLQSDLRDSRSEKQFPAAQATITASPIGAKRVQISASMNPSEPEKVEGGTYSGSILVASGAASFRVPVVAYLTSRAGVRAGFAFLLLMAGATIGLAVKWITEALSQLAAARWRLEDIRRSLGRSADSLPTQAAVQLEEIENRIMRQDTSSLDSAFAPLVANVRQLSMFSTAVAGVQREIDQQTDITWGLDNESAAAGIDRDFAKSVIEAERERIDRFRHEEWPWKDGDAVIADVQAFAGQCRTATLALNDVSRGDNVPAAKAALKLFRLGKFPEADEAYKNPAPMQVASDQDKPSRPRDARGISMPGALRMVRLRHPLSFLAWRRGGVVQWMMKRPRTLAGAASVLVVSAVGLQLQYLDDAGFAGNLGDWLGLVLWAAVIELSGVSVLDVLGRLGGGARTGPTATATQR
jgi:hypothetical protein